MKAPITLFNALFLSGLLFGVTLIYLSPVHSRVFSPSFLNLPSPRLHTTGSACLKYPDADTTKYQGYRLDLSGFEIIKQTDKWIKLRFTAVNSGRKDVNFKRKGTEHWVQINFDASLFQQKLGGLRDNIKYALYEEGFVLPAGQIARNAEIKIPAVLPPQPKEQNSAAMPPAEKAGQQNNPPTGRPPSEPRTAQNEITDNTLQNEAGPVMISSNEYGSDSSKYQHKQDSSKPAACPDILFTHLQILEQDDKWALIEYAITNQGKGVFELFGEKEGQEKLIVQAYISGAPVLSRGALPIGGQIIKAAPGEGRQLKPGEHYHGKIKLDVRKKTRYMKSLILYLESDQFSQECDKTNNSKAVILD